MTEEEKKRLREALAAAKTSVWKAPAVTAQPEVLPDVASVGRQRRSEAVQDTPKVVSVGNYGPAPLTGGISEGSEYNRGSITDLRKSAPTAAKSKAAAVGDSAFAGLTGFNKGLTGILGAAADLTDPMYKFIEEQSFYQGAPAWSRKAIDLVTGRTAQQNLKKVADYYAKADDQAQEQVRKNIEAGQMGEIGNALIQGTVQAVPSAAAAAIGTVPTASAGLGSQTTAQMMGSAVKEMASKPQFILSAVQSFGGAYDEAAAKGADTGEAITAAVLTAIPEAMIESMGGTEKLVQKIAGEAGRKGVKGAVQDILQNMAEEGLEEVVQYPVGKMAAMGYDPGMKHYSATEEAVINPVEMAKAGLVGAAVGGIVGGGAKVGDAAVGKTVGTVGDMVWTERLGKEIRDQDGGTALIRAAMESGDERLQAKAERMTEKLQRGEKLSNRELADLYQAEVESGIDAYTEEEIVKRARMGAETIEDPLTQMQREVEETERKQKTLREYLGAVDKGIMQFIQDVRDGRPKTKKPYTIGQVAPRTAADIEAITGVDVSGYTHKLTADAVRHIDKGHGTSGISDHSMMDDAHLARVAYVMEHYDQVELTRDQNGNIDYSDQYQNSDQSKALKVKFSKQIDGRLQYVIEAIPDSQRKSLWIISAYATGKIDPQAEQAVFEGIKKEGAQQFDEENSPNWTSETGAASSFNTSIPQETAESQETSATESRFGSTVPTQVVNRVIGDAAPEQDYDTRQSLKKAEDERHKAGTALLRTMYRSMGITQNADARETLRSIANQAAEEIGQTGTVSRATADRLFKEMWDRGSILQDEYYQQYKGLKDDLRQIAVSISEKDARNIPDFGRWKQQNRGRVTVTGNGMPVNRRYAELSKLHPELFPDDITHPADQLRQMAEVAEGIAPTRLTLDEGGEEAVYGMQMQFDEALREFERRIRQTNSYEQRYLEQHQPVPVPDLGTLNQTWEAYDAAVARREAVTKQHGLLTDQDITAALDVAKGSRPPESITGDARDGILALAEAERDVMAAERVIGAYKREMSGRRQEAMEDLIATSDDWIDKKTGMAYHRETQERNIRDITRKAKGGAQAAQKIIDAIYTPIHQNEAGRQRMIRDYKKQIADLGLTKEESAWVQMVGEGVRDIEAVPQVMDKAKIQQAVTLMRDQIYPDLLRQVNQVLLRNGYRPVQGRKNYFPHFQDEGDPLVKAFKMLGMRIQTDTLPTDIAGLTETFKPGKQYSGNFEQRVGDKTVYDALEGFDRYIESVSSVIWHTDDIQNLRSLETAIRHKYSKDGLREQVNAVNNDSTMSAEEREARLRELLEPDSQKHLGNFVIDLRQYTDSLAGKKSIGDRSMEQDMGRKWYSISKALEGRVAANMVALNPASWATNVIPILQASAEVDAVHLVKAMGSVLKAKGSDDGFAGQSAFLTNRKSTENLSSTTLEKITDKLSKPMEIVDGFTAETIVRAFYDQNIRRGMDPQSAMENADARAAGLMADRSKGALPTVFERKNPLIKMFTMFQTEVNNQMSWMLKDLPREYKETGAAKTAMLLLEGTMASYLYNNLYEALIGRRPAFDPLGMIFEAIGNFTEKDEEGEKKKGTARAVLDTVDLVMEQVPFVGNLWGGGRLPVGSALPEAETLVEAVGGLADGSMAPNAAWKKIGKELVKPAAYLLPPVAGGQIKKSYEGVKTWLDGGSYTTKSDGSQEMLFPVEQTPENLAKMLVFGKSSAPQANRYYENFEKSTELDAGDGGLGGILSQWFPGEDGGRDTVAENLIRKDTPRIVKWNVTDEDGLKTEKRAELTAKQQKQYREYYARYLGEGVGSLAESQRQKLREYASEMSTKRILSDVGEEYEVKDWVAEAAEAEEAGVGIVQYVGLREILNAVESDKDEDGETVSGSKAKKQREALMGRDDLTAEQKGLIDRLLIQSGEEPKQVDYSSEASLQYTSLDKESRAKVDSVRTVFPSMAVDDVDKYREACAEGTKAEKLAALQAAGMSEEDAVLFYRLNGAAADKVDTSSREAALRSVMSADERVRAAAAGYAVKGLGEEGYLVWTAALDGSEEEKKAALVSKGLTEREAEKLIRVSKLKEGDSVSSWSDVVLATLTDSQRSKFEQLQQYYPKATAAQFEICLGIYESTKADRNAAGKTISGSKKKKVIAKLMEKGLGYQAAEVFYNLMG